MQIDRGRLRTMWLLPFAAAAARLTRSDGIEAAPSLLRETFAGFQLAERTGAEYEPRSDGCIIIGRWSVSADVYDLPLSTQVR